MDDKEIMDLRRALHSSPEISGEEYHTAQTILRFIEERFNGFEVIPGLGGEGIVAKKKYGEGPEIAFRAELDGLPINEENEIPYRSKISGMSHACGHDGHMSILLRTARLIDKANFTKGTLTLLFQPAEENGKGAMAMLKDPKFDFFRPHVLYALHNIPGKPMGTVYSKKGTFACGSVGVRLHIFGKTAHAAHPEDAVNPILLSDGFLKSMASISSETKGFSLVTPISLISGEETFGTTPESSTVLLTLRAELSHDLEFMMKETQRIAEEMEGAEGVRTILSFEEFFPVTENRAFLPELEAACKSIGHPLVEMDEPNRWSEDFGHFASRGPTHMFGLGAGELTSPLHSSSYDFPENLIEIGAEIFFELFALHQAS